MTFRVWPWWVRVLQVVLGLGLVAGATAAVRGLDRDDVRLPFGLSVPGLADDDAPKRDERRAGWTSRPPTVPVLLYRVGDPPTGAVGSTTITPERFGEHLAYLAEQGYTPITASEHLAALDGAPLPERPVLLTIDGPAAAARALVPLLREHDMAATFFVADATPTPETTEAVRALLEAGEIGGQTAVPPALSELSPEEQRAAVDRNRAWLAELAGEPPVAFAYPDGDYDEHTVAALVGAGYRVAYDAWGGRAQVTSPTANRWHLARIAVSSDDTAASLAAKLAEP